MASGVKVQLSKRSQLNDTGIGRPNKLHEPTHHQDFSSTQNLEYLNDRQEDESMWFKLLTS